MDDVNEAKALIQKIREDKRVDQAGGSDENANDLQNALRMLSEELYSKPTHFILELIQNVDDNKYAEGTSPRLSIVYRNDGYLCIGCNERGSEENNVRAICRIGGSTKKGYIGEKGIGFKSVFTVADVVWITSGALEFSFEKKKPLEMIAPAWCSFEHNKNIEERTMFRFQIPENEHRRIVKRDLQGLRPELLLFLRQLRRIDVTIQSENGVVAKSFSLERNDADHVSGLGFTTLTRQNHKQASQVETEKYVVCQYTAQGMPEEKKRPNVTESNVMVAFPLTENDEPHLREREAFNFLPIRHYGLQFVLQGDFMLSANREDILQNNRWIQAIVTAARDLFVHSVGLFNKHGVLKYTWLKYLDAKGNAQETALSQLLPQLVSRLKSQSVLESLASTIEAPNDMMILPSDFTDRSIPPSPLLQSKQGLRPFSTPAYSPNDLEKLQVRPQPSSNFIALLNRYVTHNAIEFRAKPAAWHARVALATLKIGPANVSGLRMVPLISGQWVSSCNNEVYFSNVRVDLVISPGINVQIISPAASEDASRFRLFQQLGAQTLDALGVCSRILDQQKKNEGAYEAWTIANLVDHAKFLFLSLGRNINQDVAVRSQMGDDGRGIQTETAMECREQFSLLLIQCEREHCEREYLV